MGSFCFFFYRVWAKEIQRNYLSWNWTVMQNLNKHWPCEFKNGMRNWVNFHYSTQKDRSWLDKSSAFYLNKCIFWKKVAHQISTFWTFHLWPEVAQIPHVILETTSQFLYIFWHFYNLGIFTHTPLKTNSRQNFLKICFPQQQKGVEKTMICFIRIQSDL